MSRYGKAETLAIAAAVLFSVLFFVLFFAFVPISAGLKQRRTPSSSATAADHTYARPAESHKRHTTANRSRRNDHEPRIRGMRPLRRDGGHILRDMPLLRVQARQAGTVLPALPRLGREPARKGD